MYFCLYDIFNNKHIIIIIIIMLMLRCTFLHAGPDAPRLSCAVCGAATSNNDNTISTTNKHDIPDTSTDTNTDTRANTNTNTNTNNTTTNNMI